MIAGVRMTQKSHIIELEPEKKSREVISHSGCLKCLYTQPAMCISSAVTVV